MIQREEDKLKCLRNISLVNYRIKNCITIQDQKGEGGIWKRKINDLEIKIKKKTEISINLRKFTSLKLVQ
jgi:hypothetical protein